MLLLNRRDAVNEDLVTIKEKWGWSFWKKGMLSRKLMDFFSGKTKNFYSTSFSKKPGVISGKCQRCASKSFSQQWKERNVR